MLLILLSALALAAPAGDPPPDAPDPADAPLPDRATPLDRLREAWRRVDAGDQEGARLLASEALRDDPGLAEEVAYLEGVTHQLAGEDDRALARFDDLLARFPDGERARDATFRRALVLGHADRFEDSLDGLRGLRPLRTLPDEARRKVTWCEATWTLAAGRARPGLRAIDRALATAAPGELPWFQARARSEVLHHAVDAARALDFDVPDRALRRVLEARARYVLTAEEQLEAIVDLAEHAFVLDGLLAVGGAYEAIATDFLAAPVPATLPPEEAARYRTQVTAKASAQLVKARKYYDLGMEHAARIAWPGPESAALQAALTRVDAAVEALPPP